MSTTLGGGAEAVAEAGEATLPDVALIEALAGIPDVVAELSDLLDARGLRLVAPASRLVPLDPGVRLVGRCVTLRYAPARRDPARVRAESPEGGLANAELAGVVRAGDVVVIESPDADVSVLGSEVAARFQAAGVRGAIVAGALRDPEGLLELGFPAWASGRTAITGRWRLEAVDLGGPVTVGGVQAQEGDIVVADRGGVCFVPQELFAELASAVLAKAGGSA